MKKLLKFKYVFLLAAAFLLAVNTVTPVQAMQVSQEDVFPETVVVDGVERKVREVTWEEYGLDNSGDFLVVVNKEPQIPVLSNLAPKVVQYGVIEKVAVWVADQLAGYILTKGFEYLVGSVITKTAALNAYQAIIAAFTANWLLISLVVIVTVVVLVNTVNTVYAPDRVINNNQCVWNGRNQYQGTWLCPMRL